RSSCPSASVLLASPSRLASLLLFNPPPTPEIYTLSLHDALPICEVVDPEVGAVDAQLVRADGDVDRVVEHLAGGEAALGGAAAVDRKSTRLNSSHVSISYAVFCLKKKSNRSRS